MMETKNCRVCHLVLTTANWSENRKKKNDYMCKACKAKELKEIRVETTEVMKDGHSIERRGNSAPVITINDVDKIDIKKMIRDTELFRIEQVMRLIRAGNKDNVRKVGIDYLLKVSDLLIPEQAVEVINEANKMIKQTGVEDAFKLKVAIALRNFIATREGKADKPLSYEEILQKGGEIDIDEV